MTFAEITGTNFQNKGAELMLAAAARECRRRGVSPVVFPWIGGYEQRALLGLWQKAHFQRFGIRWHRGARFMPARLRRQFGIVEDREIDVVLDASGFQLGDQWGSEIATDMAVRIEAAARSGKKVVLLPQAFGPFEKAEMRVPVRRIIDSAVMVFARDPDSHSHLCAIAPDADNIRQAPDFTNLIDGTLPSQSVPPNTACILPNQRMLDKSDAAISSSYVEFLVHIAQKLDAAGYRLTSLIHETQTDRAVLDAVNSRLERPIALQEAGDALAVKGVLGQCSLVVASRFHALASALSQGVPCIASGWNHKYEHLMDDYGCSGWLVDPASPAAGQQVERLLEAGRLDENRKTIIDRAPALKAQSRAMWDEVFAAIGVGRREQTEEPL